VSYFRLQQPGKIGPGTIHSFSDSTSLLSQNAGQVKGLSKDVRTGLIFTDRTATGTSRPLWSARTPFSGFRPNVTLLPTFRSLTG